MIASQLVELAQGQADGAQATVRRTESTEVKFESDRLKATQSSQSTQIEVKVIRDGKVGISSTTDVSDLEGVVARALEAAQFGSPANFQFPAAQELPQVQLYDEGVVSLTTQEMVKIGEEMIPPIKAHDPEVLVDAEVSKAIHQVELANSAGATLTSQSTEFGVYVEGILIRGSDVLEVGEVSASKKLLTNHMDLVDKTINWLRLTEQTATIGSGTMPVILTPSAVSVLVLTLLLATDGKDVLLGASPLADDEGRRIADSRFSLVDDPLLDFGPRSSRFDGEGSPRQTMPVIEEGVLSGFRYDLDTAGKAKVTPTGHGPSRAATNLLIPEGDVSFEQMVQSIDEGLLVHEMLGMGQGNAINGEFSVNVQLGFKIEKGKIVGRVKDVMLAGNVYNALNDIVAIGDKAEWQIGRMTGQFPHIQIGGLSVIAK